MNIEEKYLNEKTIDDILTGDKIDKIKKSGGHEKSLKLFYEWIKTGNISYKEFKIILDSGVLSK